MNHHLRAGLVALIVVAQIAIGVFAADPALTDEIPKAPPAPQRDQAAPATTASMRQTAETQARAWQADATLIEEVSWLSWPADLTSESGVPVNGWSTFVFASGGNRLAVVIDRGSGFILGQHVQQLGVGAGRALDPTADQVTAETASAVAEILGGKEYRESCPQHRDLSKVGASVDANGTPIWAVTYADDRTANNSDVTVVIDARTGSVERTSVSMPPCEKS
jgi:hypothetical protein